MPLWKITYTTDVGGMGESETIECDGVQPMPDGTLIFGRMLHVQAVDMNKDPGNATPVAFVNLKNPNICSVRLVEGNEGLEN